jgi:1,2-phenylacetyl-CoA epoxidase catalytic subunit
MFVLIVTPCIPVVEYHRFQKTYGLHLQVNDEIRGTFRREVGIQLQEYTVSQPGKSLSALSEFVCFTSRITYYSEQTGVATTL